MHNMHILYLSPWKEHFSLNSPPLSASIFLHLSTESINEFTAIGSEPPNTTLLPARKEDSSQLYLSPGTMYQSFLVMQVQSEPLKGYTSCVYHSGYDRGRKPLNCCQLLVKQVGGRFGSAPYKGLGLSSRNRKKKNTDSVLFVGR